MSSSSYSPQSNSFAVQPVDPVVQNMNEELQLESRMRQFNQLQDETRKMFVDSIKAKVSDYFRGCDDDTIRRLSLENFVLREMLKNQKQKNAALETEIRRRDEEAAAGLAHRDSVQFQQFFK